MAVEIEWIDSISAAATGNKIYRDTVPSTGKVEVADIANGNQIYQDDTAEVGTGVEYKYSIQAHDGAGDETTQEVEGDNMDFITTAGAAITNYVFDGSANSYFLDEAATPTLLDGVVNQTWIIRVKRTAIGVQQGILGSPDGTGVIKLEVDSDDNQMDGTLEDTGTSVFTNGAVSTDLDWHVYALYYDGTNFGVWEDASYERTNVNGGFTGRTPGRILAVGISVIGGGSQGLLIGEMSDVQFYNRLLTDTEIQNVSADLTDLPTDSATSLVANFAGNKQPNEWASEVGSYVLTNQGGVTTN